MNHSLKRDAGLDLLRCVAILLVIGRHVMPHTATENPLLNLWHHVGWLGVDLFFVLSGYLISGLIFGEYQKTGRFNVSRFLVRRGLKIYPAYFFFLGYCFLRLPGWEERLASSSSLVLIQNYVGAFSRWGHTWSLCVEEHFYLLFAFGFAFLSLVKRWQRMFIGVACAVLVGCLLARLGAVANDVRPGVIYTQTHFRLDSLMIGVLLRYAVTFSAVSWPRWILVGVAVLPWVWAAVIPWENPWMLTVGLSALPLASAAMVLLSVGRFESSVWNLPCWIGRNSYGIYLWHVTVQGWTLKFTSGLPAWVELSLVTTTTVLFGWLVTRLVETPVLKLRDRIFPARARP